MKPSLALQFLSTAFTATVAVSSSSASVAEAAAKKYDNDNHRDADADAAAASRAVPVRNLESTSKAGKSSVSCPPKPTPDVQCGNTYVNSTVILGQNLICTEGRDGSSYALALIGKKALLDCQGYTISQNTNSSAAALDGTEDLFFGVGVLLMDGARMRNCNIQKFNTGGEMFNAGEIKDSEFSLNRWGVDMGSYGGNNVVNKIVNT